MAQFNYYPQEKLPPLLHQQILDFLRIVFPDGFMEENKLRNWVTNAEDHPVSFILTENDLLISHLQVVWKYLEHKGITYKVYGLTGVFTYPSFQKQGYGAQLLKKAKEYIKNSDADIVMFHSTVKEFYEKSGFEAMKNVVTLKGDKSNPEISNETPFMLFFSDKGKKGRSDFEESPVYFGEDTW